MADFYKEITSRINSLKKERNITNYRLSKLTGIPEGSISKSTRGLGEWKAEHLHKIAGVFKVSLEWLIRGEPSTGVKESRTFTREGLDTYTQRVLDKKLRKVPILGYAECGQPIPQTVEPGTKFLEIANISQFSSPFILVAKGDSMQPYINPGDKLLAADMPSLIKPMRAVIVAFKSGAEQYEANAKLIKFDKGGKIILYSVNTKYPPTIHDENDIYKIYKLMTIIREVK
jgi:repressor LexA